MTEGVVKAHSFVRVLINFSPTVCGNYYERVFCIVRNHKVLFVDLMGTCFDILTKPIPLQQRHIDNFRTKVIMGSHKKMVSKHQAKIKSEEFIMTHDSLSLEMDTVTEEEGTQVYDSHNFEANQTTLHKEMLQSNTSELKDLKFSNEFLDFGFTLHGSISDDREFTL